MGGDTNQTETEEMQPFAEELGPICRILEVREVSRAQLLDQVRHPRLLHEW